MLSILVDDTSIFRNVSPNLPHSPARRHWCCGLSGCRHHSQTKTARWIGKWAPKLVSSPVSTHQSSHALATLHQNDLDKMCVSMCWLWQPQPPMDQKFFRLWGHLPLAEELNKKFPKGAHMHLLPTYLRDKYNLPDLFYVDWYVKLRIDGLSSSWSRGLGDLSEAFGSSSLIQTTLQNLYMGNKVCLRVTGSQLISTGSLEITT